MVILRRLIKEFVRQEIRVLSEGHINIPQSELDKVPELFSYIKKNKDDIDSHVYVGRTAKSFSNPYLPADLRGFFVVKDKNGNETSIDVGFYSQDEESVARMSIQKMILMLNLDNFDSQRTPADLEITVVHELTHALDPFMKHPSYEKYRIKHKLIDIGDKEIDDKSNPKTGVKMQDERFFKSQHEYAAFLNEIITVAKRFTRGDKFKIDRLIRFAAGIPNHNTDEWKEQAYSIFKDDANDILSVLDWDRIKSWSIRPTQFKKFLRDLSIGLGAGVRGSKKIQVGTEVL